MWINGVSDKFPQTDNSGPVRVKIPTSDKALKQQHKTNETVMNKMKMGWNCNSDEENHKYNTVNSLIATASRKRPLPISDHFKNNRFVSQANTVSKTLS